MLKILSKITGWYFTKKALPYWGVLLLDCLIVLFSAYLGAYVELRGLAFLQSFGRISIMSLLCVLLFVISFRIFRTYFGIIRYSSFIDLQHVIGATALGSLFVGAVSWALHYFVQFNLLGIWGIGVLFFMSTLLMWFMRIMVRILFENFRIDLATPVAIYGTKAGGISLANSLSSIKNKEYRLMAFISDTTEMENSTLYLGLPCFDRVEDLKGLGRIDDLIVYAEEVGTGLTGLVIVDTVNLFEVGVSDLLGVFGDLDLRNYLTVLFLCNELIDTAKDGI